MGDRVSVLPDGKGSVDGRWGWCTNVNVLNVSVLYTD